MEQQFRYSANALGLGGTIRRPALEFTSSPSAVLSPAGGSANWSQEDFYVEGIFSFRSAAVSVRGGMDERGNYSTIASVRIGGLNVMDVLTADVIVGRLIAKHQGREQSKFFVSGCQIQNLRIAGEAANISLDMDVFDGANYLSLAERYDKDPRFRKSMNPENAAEWRSGKPMLLSLVGALETSAHVERKGNSVSIPQFGRVRFCELLVSPMTWKLEMLRVKLGSPVEGEVTVGSVDVNGTWYP